MVQPVLEYLLANGVISTSDTQVLTSAADHAEWLGKPLRGRAGLTSPEALEVLTWLEPSKARTMRRHVGKLLSHVADHLRTVDIDQLLEDHPGGDVTYEDWALGLGQPRHAAAARRFRDVELFLTRHHVATWDADTGLCGTPNVCPECIRASQGAG